MADDISVQAGNKAAGRVTTVGTWSGNGSATGGVPVPERAQGVARRDRLFEMWATPVVLLLLCVLSYGLLIPWLGFYWDDWPAMWVLHSQGGEGLRAYTAADRPFLGWIYAMTGPVFGEGPLSWHLLALVARWMSSVALWWCLRGLWPARAGANATAACLFAVYPGFTLQPIGWCHSHVFLMLGLVMSSFGAMVWAERLDGWYWPLTILSVSCAAVPMLLSEYFVGLELLRPVLLGTILAAGSKNLSARLFRILRSWLPFLVLLALYLVWRLMVFHPSGVNDESQVFQVIQSHPLGYFFHRLYVVVTDVIEACLVAWTRTVGPDLFTFGSIRWVIVGLGLIVAGTALTFWFLKELESRSVPVESHEENVSWKWTTQAMGIGMVAVLVGGLPFWFGNRDIRLDTLADRYTIPVMLGCVLILAAFTHMMMKRTVQRMTLIGLLVGLSIGFHFRNSIQFLHDWSDQTSLFWQLSWRAPGLKPGTLLLADESVISFPRSYSLFGAANFLYAPRHDSSTLNYGFFGLPTVLGDELSSLSDGQPFRYVFRTLSFTASTSESLALWFSPPSCLRILDPARDEIPHLSPLAQAARRISHPDRVLPEVSDAAVPPAAIFGREPAHSWCYFFQKADLARQRLDWQQVTRMADEAKRAGLSPKDSAEWVPFVEGYLQTGREDEAKELLVRMVEDIPAVRSVLAVYDPNRVDRRPVPQIVPTASPALCRALERFESLASMTVKAGCPGI